MKFSHFSRTDSIVHLTSCNLLFRQMFGDEALGEINVDMVMTARSVGAAAKFTGSGGAVVAFCPEGSDQVKRLSEACEKKGFTLIPIQVAPSNVQKR